MALQAKTLRVLYKSTALVGKPAMCAEIMELGYNAYAQFVE